MEIILDESGYSKMLKDKKDLESEGRLENLKELIRGMRGFDNLQSFLEHVALATSIDQNWDGEKVNLMTMHASKGLEFDAIFLPGWEEGLFPHQKSLEEKGDLALEEERRLAYVGLTRAKKESFISFVMSRMYRGDWVDSLASRFIDELPEENIEKEEVKEQDTEDFFFKSNLHLLNRFKIFTNPNFVFGLILSNCKSSTAESSKDFLFFLLHSCNCFNALSPTDLLGTLIILSKAKSSFF